MAGKRHTAEEIVNKLREAGVENESHSSAASSDRAKRDSHLFGEPQGEVGTELVVTALAGR